MELTKSEMEIMDVFWDSEQALSRADLLERSKERSKSWKDSSIHILLNGLLQKQVIHEAGFVKRNKTYGRIFLPSMTREGYFASSIFGHPSKPQVVGLFRELLRRPEVTAADLEALIDLAAQVKQNLL